MGKIRVNTRTLPMKAHYFLFNAGTVPLMPYLPVYARQLGVSQVGVGLMYSVLPFIGLVAKPVAGALADRFQIGKLIFLLAIFLTGACFGGIGLIPGRQMMARPVTVDCTQDALMTCSRSGHCNSSCLADRVGVATGVDGLIPCRLDCPEWLCPSSNVSVCPELTFQANFSALEEADGGCLRLPLQRQLKSICSDPFGSLNCSVVCDGASSMDFFVDADIHEEEPFWKTLQFQLLFSLMVGGFASQVVVVSLSDSICFQLLGDRPQDYGMQRLWGAVGWGLLAIISGYLIDLASLGQPVKDYTSSFYLMIGLLALNIICVTRIQIDYHQEPKALGKVCKLLSDPRAFLFLGGCACFGMCTGFIWQFLFWWLEDLGGADGRHWIKLLQGLAMGIQCFGGEVPSLFLSGWVLKKLGHVRTMTIALVFMGLHLMTYSFLTNPWYTLPIELSSGLTLGIYWSVMASYANLVAPPGAGSTLQGIFGAAFDGLGTSTGSLLGGWIYQQYGGVAAFRTFGTFSLVAAVVFGSAHQLIGRNRSSKTGVPDSDDDKKIYTIVKKTEDEDLS